MSEHIADLVSRQDLRDEAERKVRELALKLEVMGNFDLRMYVPPGPVAREFLNSTFLTPVIMGPLGGGKTTTCVFKRIVQATRQPIARHPEDGKPTRMSKWIVLRDTFRSAERTVLESWKQWFPKTYPGSSSQGGNDRPFLHRLRFIGQDGIRVEAITVFAGLGDDSIETMMKGSEWDGGWLNELDTHNEGAIDDVEQRVGRYPMADLILSPRELEELAEQMGLDQALFPGARQKCVIGDMNAPTVDNWTYEKLLVSPGPDRKLYKQPSGRSAEAENRFNLEPDYYDRIIANQDERFVRRMVENEFGYSRAGKAVHPSFDHRRHVADREVPLDPNLDLHIGIDVSTGGLSPAAMLAQAATRIRMIDELYVGHGVGPTRFAQALKDLMNERYPNVPRSRVKLWPDPASQYGADKEGGELNALEIMQEALGVVARVPGDGSNSIGLRLAVIDRELRGFMEPNTSLLISARCKQYIGAMGGKYRYRKKPDSATNDYDDMPEKAHPWSDLADAGQYVCMGIRGPASLRDLLGELNKQKQEQGWRSQNGVMVPSGWKSQGGFDPHKAGL